MTSFFVRVCVGDMSGVPVYVLARIVGTRDGSKTYSLTNGKPTRKYLSLQIGKSCKDMIISKVSNQKLQRKEYLKWEEKMTATKSSLPSKV